MAIERITKQQEAELVDSVMNAVKLANAGAHPNDAIVKVATEKGYGKPYVNRMIEAFNVSKSIKHRRDSQGEEKAAGFSIADPAVIFSRMYPDDVQAPAEVKGAEWEPAGTNMVENRIFNLENAPVLSEAKPEVHSYGQQSIELLMKRACDELHRQERSVADLRQDMSIAREQLRSGIIKLAAYFRQIPHEPFERFEKAALTIAGQSIKPLMNTLWDLAKRASDRQEKRASDASQIQVEDRRPYTMLNEILELRAQYAKVAVKCAALETELTKYASGLKDRMHTMQKQSAPGLEALAPFMLGRLLPGTNDSLKGMAPSKALSPSDITSVDFDAERQGIQTQSMLHDLMQNDEVLRRAKPEHVVKAYNDLATVAPRAVGSPMILRGLLRKAVESPAYDPYELANLVSMETGLKKRDVPDTEPAAKEPRG